MKDMHGGDIWAASRSTGRPPENILDFSASINPLGLPPAARKALRGAFRLIPPYPDPEAAGLVKAISEAHGTAPQEILPGNGSTEFIYLIPQVFRPQRALIVEPAFSEYRSSLDIFGCPADGLPLREKDGFRLCLESLQKAMKKGYGLLYLANPANPTGALTDKEEVFEIARLCRRAGTVLIVDEAFSDYSEGESIIKDAARLKNAVVLRSMTKFYAMAGLRLGFIAANGNIIKRFSRLKPPWSVNTLASIAGAAALRDAAYRKKTLSWFARESRFLFKGLGAIEGLKVYPSAANYFLARIDFSGLTATRLRRALYEKNILVRDLSAFKGLGPEYFRAAIKSRADNIRLLEALKEVFGAKKKS